MRAWQARGFLACLLWPASQLYRGLIQLRHSLFTTGFFTSHHVGVPVLVVGNIVAGGAGKTPLVMALVQHFQAQGVTVGVISRGYGRKGSACQEVLDNTPIQESGDEPALIKRLVNAPVFVAPRRIDAARALLLAHPATELLVCDDGLQHYALHRDIDIAVFDDRGVGNGWLLPAGPLRETWPLRNGLGFDLVLHTGQTPTFEGYRSSRQLASHAVAADGSAILLSSLQGQPLAALAAIANPGAFFAMLAAVGLKLDQTISLPDHHDFSNDVLPVKPGMTVLCTEKDAIKLFRLPSMTHSSAFRLLAVPLLFSPEPAFLNAVDALLAPLLLPHAHSELTSGDGH